MSSALSTCLPAHRGSFSPFTIGSEGEAQMDKVHLGTIQLSSFLRINNTLTDGA